MKKLAIFCLTLSLLLAFSLPVFAQDEAEDEERDFLEVSLFGNLTVVSGGLSDWVSKNPNSDTADVPMGVKSGYGAGIEVGLFLTPNIVLGGSFAYSRHDVETSASIGELKHRFFNPAIYLRYYFFGESNLVPYVKGQVGLNNAKFVTKVFNKDTGREVFRELSYDPALSFGASAGAFYYTSDYSGLFLDANMNYGFSDNVHGTFNDIDYDFVEKTTLFSIQAGIRVFFGSGD